ncbi:MAG: hypothetical protein QXW82_03715 [Candidatus Bathyarchaeia archaeon]
MFGSGFVVYDSRTETLAEAVVGEDAGGKVVTLENIGRVLGAFNLKWIKPDLAVETPRVKDLERAEKLGEKLAKICSCKTATSPFEFGETFQGAIEMGILTK